MSSNILTVPNLTLLSSLGLNGVSVTNLNADLSLQNKILTDYLGSTGSANQYFVKNGSNQPVWATPFITASSVNLSPSGSFADRSGAFGTINDVLIKNASNNVAWSNTVTANINLTSKTLTDFSGSTGTANQYFAKNGSNQPVWRDFPLNFYFDGSYTGTVNLAAITIIPFVTVFNSGLTNAAGTITIPAGATGLYRVDVNGTVNRTVGTDVLYWRYTVNGSLVGVAEVMPGPGSILTISWTSMRFLSLNAADQLTIRAERALGSTGNMAITNGRLIITRIS